MRVQRGKGIRLFGVGFLFLLAGLRPALAQGPGRLTEFDYFLLGLRVRPDPPAQVVPKNTPTGLRLALDASSASVSNDTLLALLPPGLEVAAELVGPGIDTPIQLRGQPGDLLPIPALVTRGVYLVRDLRLVKPDGTTFLRALPDTATVEVIEQILITQVTTRPLTLDEIRQKGILFGDDSFHGLEFTIVMRFDSRPVNINLHAIFDSKNVPIPIRTSTSIDIQGPSVPVFNATFVPVMLDFEPGIREKIDEILPEGVDITIPGLLVIPGDVGFLNQFFSALLIVTNGAPQATPLVVSGLKASIALPKGDDQVPGTADDPLVIAKTESGQALELPLIGPGPDGTLGTGDDSSRFAPAEQGQAEFLLEGKKEGFHAISFDIAGTLEGLPIGPVALKGKAQGGVLVRNPSFHMTFSAPATVRAGEEFNLYVTVTNVSTSSTANLVRVRLGPGVAGARVIPSEGDDDPDPAVEVIPTIAPQSSEVISFRFASNLTGQVTASYLKFDQDPTDHNTGELQFHLGVGERGIPLSPDTIVLPKSIETLPRAVVTAALRVLGLGWSIATAPPGALPKGVNRIGKQAVIDRALDLAEAGFRRQLGEPEVNTLSNLFFSWAAAEGPGFDQLARQPSGVGFFNAVGAALAPSAQGSLIDFHRDLEDSFTSLPPHILLGVGSGSGVAPVTWSFQDGGGRKLDSGGATRDLKNGAFIPLAGAGRSFAFVGDLGAQQYVGRLSGTEDGGRLDLAVGVPLSEGAVEIHTFSGVAIDKDIKALLQVDFLTGTPVVSFGVDRNGDGIFEPTPSSVQVLRSRGPQLRAATALGPETLNGADPWGRVLALLFDREVRKDEADRVASYRAEENVVLSASRQLSGRVVFLFLRDPAGDLVTRRASVSGLFDETGEPMSPFEVTTPIASLLEDDAGIVSGRVLTADGKPVTGAQVLYANSTQNGPIGVSQKQVKSDGSYQFDWVRRSPYGPFFIQALDPQTGGFQELSTNVRTNGDHIVVDLVLLGRGGVRGIVTDGAGPVPGARVAVVSQTDPASFDVTETDSDGRYAATDIVVGPVSVKAVKGVFVGVAAGNIPRAGTFTTVDVSLNESGGSVSGRVAELVSDSLVPLVGMDVYYVVPRPGSFFEIVVAVVQTDSNGAYRFEGLPTGPFRALAVDRVTGRQKDAAGTNAGQDIRDLDILFINTPEQVGTIRGQVRDGSDRLVDATVFGAGRQVQAVGGLFEMKDVPPGNRPLTAVRAGSERFATGSANVKANEVTNVVLRFPGLGRIKVKVLDPQGVPISGLQVVRLVNSACGGEIQTTSGSDAVATFENVPVPGAQFKTVRLGDVAEAFGTLRADGDETLLTLQFGGFGSVTGKIFEADGFAHGAIVTLGARTFDRTTCALAYDSRAAQVRADTKGEFRFENVSVGTFTVSAKSAITDSEASAKDVLVKHGETKDFVFTLKPNLAGKLSGRVFLPAGAIPAGPGVSVTVSSGNRPDVTVVTQPDGSYEFAKIFPPGNYTLTAVDPITGTVGQQMVSLQKEQDLVVDLRLLGRGAVEVKVVDGGGNPVTEAFVELKGSKFPFDQAAGALRPSDAGTIRFERISEGDFSVTASDRFGRGGRASGTVAEEGATAQVVVSLTVTGTVKGIVKSSDGSRAIPNAEVRLRQGTTGRLLGSTVSSSDPAGDKLGTFEFQYVPAGTVLATATDPLTGRLGEASGRIDNQDQVLSLTIQLLGLGRISGKVTNGPDAQVGAKVDLKSTTGLQSAQANLEATATTGSDGAFVFEGVPVGSFTLKATVPGLELTGTTTGVIHRDGDDKRADIALEASGSVSGTLFRADGVTTVPGADVTLQTRRGVLRSQSSLAGRYHFDFVLTGDVTAAAEHTASGDAGIAQGTVTEGEDLPLDVVFNGTGAIQGTAFESDGLRPLTEGTVFLSRNAPFPRNETASVGVDGTFTFLRIPVGDFSLTLVPKNSPLRGTFMGKIENDGDVFPAAIRLADSGAVLGNVVREDSTTAVPRAAIQVSGPGFSISDLADANGSFRIEGIPKAKFTVRIEDPVSGGLAEATGEVKQNGDEVNLGIVTLDESPIAVESIDPDGTVPVSLESSFVVHFTDPVAASSVTLVEVREGPKGLFVKHELSPDGFTITVSPFGVFPPNTTVTLIVPKSLRDRLGRPLGKDTLKTFQTTGAIVVGRILMGSSPVPGAAISLTGPSLTRTTTANDAGEYRFDDLPFKQGSTDVVTVEAIGPGGLKGRAEGSFAFSGKITLDVAITATGSVSGTVFRSDGVTLLAGAEVSINRSLAGLPTTVLSNALGRYAFDFVPIGDFTISVSEPSTGDRGVAMDRITVSGESRAVNVRMNGLGRVVVEVKDPAENLVSSAQVTLRSLTSFDGSQFGTTGGDGIVVFERVLAGSFTVTATDPATQLSGSTSGSVGVDGTTNVTVRLEPVGTILGHVLAPDGVSPAAGVLVRLFQFGFSRQTTSAGDGAYRFDAVPLGTYTLEAVSGSRVRARETGIRLTSNGQIVIRDLTLVGLGTVTGTVRNQDLSPAARVGVSLRSHHPALGQFFSAVTDDAGQYGVDGVPVGSFTATVLDLSRGIFGETSGQIEQDGQHVTADIQLRSNVISLPRDLFDANDFKYDIQTNGTLFDGTQDAYDTAYRLSLGATAFGGSSLGTIEDGNREVAIRQGGLGGLDVTRKIFVPQDGYFARYLEILTNPGPDSRTVDVEVASNLGSDSATGIIDTSSGDSSLTPEDFWLVTDDDNGSNPFPAADPTLAHVLGGPDATVSVNATTLTGDSLLYRWSAVTIPPGSTRILMHFAVQQSSQPGAITSARRLVQLPPEALTGLSPEEVAAIQNFAVPPDGRSNLPPLPPLRRGTVTGRVLAGDGATAVPSAKVTLRGGNLFFGKVITTTSTGAGTFTVANVPVDSFTLQALDPISSVLSPVILGTFAEGATEATRDVLFSNTGLVRGVVRRHTGTPVAAGSVLFSNVSVPIRADGSYLITGLLPGSYTLRAFVNHPQGTSLTGVAEATVTEGQASIVDITIELTGGVTGTVRTGAGAPASNVLVELLRSDPVRSTRTDGLGQYLLTDVPVGNYTVRATEPNSGVTSAVAATVIQDQLTTQDFMLIGLGVVQLQANVEGGGPAPGARVDILETARGNFFRSAGTTDASGRLTIPNVTAGAFTVRVFTPGTSDLFTDVNGNLSAHGEIVVVTVEVPSVGIVTGRVSRANGAAASGSSVSVFGPDVPRRSGTTDAAGNYVIARVAARGPFTVRATVPGISAFFREVPDNVIPSNGATLTVNVTLPAVATLRVTVQRSDSTPFAGVRVEIQNSFNGSFQSAGVTDNQGVLTIANVPEGAFKLRARIVGTNALVGTAEGAVRSTDDTLTVDALIKEPPAGTLQGTVHAADDLTPVAFALVEVLNDLGELIRQTSTDRAGFYSLTNVAAGTSEFVVRGHSPVDSAVVAERRASFTEAGQTLTIDLTLPLSVVKGTVYFADGSTPAPFPSVFVTQEDALGLTRTLVSNQSDDAGRYVVLGADVGELTVTGQVSSGLFATARGELAAIDVAVTVDVVLPPSATVAGTVFDADGAVVPSARVALTSTSLAFDRVTEADEDGRFQFDRVALGSVLVQAAPCQDDGDGGFTCDFFGSTSGTISTPDETVTLDVTLPATGSVEGMVFEADGVTPLPGAPVFVENLAYGGPLGSFRRDVFSDSSGFYGVSGIPVGTVRVIAVHPDDSTLGGSVEGSLASGETLRLNVTVSERGAQFTFNLDGADGFRYDVGCSGDLIDGGTTNGSLFDAYDSVYLLSILNRSFSCVSRGSLEGGAREVVLGPEDQDGLLVSRKVFVPTEGGFARYLETVTNKGVAPRAVTVRVSGNLGSDSSTRIVVPPSETNRTFLITDDTIGSDPTLGHVFGGEGRALPVTVRLVAPDRISYSWNVQVPAGGTVILMHFAVQRAPFDTDGARSQSEALASLSDPNALAEMSAQERARVLNFVIP